MYQILKDVLVIELSAFVAGPLSGLILGQLGANVVRIDPTDEPIDFKRFPIDKKGNSYRLKKEDNLISLSSLRGSNVGVGKDYSTVMG